MLCLQEVCKQPSSIYGAEFLCYQMPLSCFAWDLHSITLWLPCLVVYTCPAMTQTASHFPTASVLQTISRHCTVFRQHAASNLSRLLVWCVGELMCGWMCLCYLFNLTSLTYCHQLSVVTLTRACVTRQQSRVWSSASRRTVAGITFWWACSWGRWPEPCSKGLR